MVRALRERSVSASELLELHLARIAQFDGVLNSVVVRDFARARHDAAAADELLSRGVERPLLGLPMTVKESIDVEGLASTAGVEFRSQHRAARDALTVRRLRHAGAVLVGKTNICTWLADYIGENPLFGRTNNPWDLSRTSGGSSAGSAALAAGLIPLELGSDLAGSIRVPAAFCSLVGHKPSCGLVPNSGHFPGSALPNPGTVLAVQGPHGRSAADVALCLDVVAGPDVDMDAAWHLRMPAPRHQVLADFRVAVIEPPAWIALDPEIRGALENCRRELGKQCKTVEVTDLSEVANLKEYFHLFRAMMNVLISIGWPAEKRQQTLAAKLATGDELAAADARGLAAGGSDYLMWLGEREQYRMKWGEFFARYDVLITPTTLLPAFEHPTVPPFKRRMRIDGRECGFDDLSFYPALASLAGLPGTAFPFGFSGGGLPLGLQAIGPFLEDYTPLKFAELLEGEFGGFRPPPGYEV
jgi:amidase